MHIPPGELKITFARSSGAGGQNVNKTSTKAIVRWPFLKSKILSIEEKGRIYLKLAGKVNNKNELVIDSEEQRSQFQNKRQAVARLEALVTQALRVPKKRRPTRPTLASKIRKIETKKQRSQIKKTRRTVID